MAKASPEVSQAASSMSKSDVKDFAKTKHDGLPEKKESMNYTEFCDSLCEPTYQVEGKVSQDAHPDTSMTERKRTVFLRPRKTK